MNKEEIEARIESMKGLYNLLTPEQQENILNEIGKIWMIYYMGGFPDCGL